MAYKGQIQKGKDLVNKDYADTKMAIKQPTEDYEKIPIVNADGNLELQLPDFKDTGAIGEFKQAPYLLPNFVVADGTTDYDKLATHKRLFEVLTENCPELLIAGSDADHFRLLDLRGRYVKNGDDVALGDESLPNAKGTTMISNYGGNAGVGGFTEEGEGIIVTSNSVNETGKFTNTISKTTYRNIEINLSKGNAVYQDGAKVNPDNVTMLPLIRYRNDKVEVNVIQQMLDLTHPIGSSFVQRLSNENPNDLFNDVVKGISSTWELSDEVQAGDYMMIDNDKTVGTRVSEELPNIKGATDKRGARFGWYSTNVCEGAIDKAENGPTQECSAGDVSHHGIQLLFDASKGQTNSDGSYVPQAQSVFKDGGKVHPQGFTVKLWVRTA